MMSDTPEWWKTGIIYQIYPRSFQDTTGSGVGDLNGILRRLPYIRSLGIDAIWISPIYPSPMTDAGYDVSDYTGIDLSFGTMEDFEALVRAAHRNRLRVLLDFVPSHSSDRHPWFIASRSSRESPKRDWYIWRDARPDGGPPTNWISEFGGPAWTWDEATGQYYLNIYAREQPALNWRNPDLRAVMYETMAEWFDRGVDGFRVDAVEHLMPDAELRDNLPDPDWRPGGEPARALQRTYTAHQPGVFEIVCDMRRIADRYPGRVLLGEAYGTLDEVMRYYGAALDGFHLPFNFELIKAPWSPRHIADHVDAYEAALPPGGWPNWVLGNHDRSRVASRFGAENARVAAMLLLTLRGTPTIYQGEELGMIDEPVPQHMIQDPWALTNPGSGLGRDPVRIPIPWDDGPGRGFTAGTPWLPLSTVPSVAAQEANADSMLAFYRRLVALRRDEPALNRGDYARLHVDEAVFAYARSDGDSRLAVALNFSGAAQKLPLGGKPILSTEGTARRTDMLRPHEGVILAT